MFAWLRKTLSLLGALGRGTGERQLPLIAAGVAFYTLLAIFPAITALVTLWGFFADPDIVAQQLSTYQQVMPAEAYDILFSRVHSIASGPKNVLGWASALSLLAALWATRAGVAALIGGLNAVYDTPRRGRLRGMAVSMLLTLILIAVTLIAMATVVVAPVVLAFMPLGPFTEIAVQLLRWIVSVGVVLLGIGLLYRLGPNRPGVRSPLLSAGSVFAVVSWALLSFGFSAYLENFSRLNEIYGSLGAVIALLLWFYLSAFVVLLGGLLNAELERRNTPMVPDEVGDEPAEDIVPVDPEMV